MTQKADIVVVEREFTQRAQRPGAGAGVESTGATSRPRLRNSQVRNSASDIRPSLRRASRRGAVSPTRRALRDRASCSRASAPESNADRSRPDWPYDSE